MVHSVGRERLILVPVANDATMGDKCYTDIGSNTALRIDAAREYTEKDPWQTDHVGVRGRYRRRLREREDPRVLCEKSICGPLVLSTLSLRTRMIRKPTALWRRSRGSL